MPKPCRSQPLIVFACVGFQIIGALLRYLNNTATSTEFAIFSDCTASRVHLRPRRRPPPRNRRVLPVAARAGPPAADSVLRESPWSVLGLPQGAGRKAIKARFKQLVAAEHPDKHPGDAAALNRFKEINLAYQALVDEEEVRAAQASQREQAVEQNRRETKEVYEEMGIDVEAYKSFFIATSTAVAVLALIVGYFALTDPMQFIKRIFPDATDATSQLSEADKIRLGLQDSPEIREFYKQRSGKVPTRDDFVDNDREWLAEKEKTESGPDVINTYG